MNEASRFFAHWLRNEDTGIMKEPPVPFYMQETYETGSADSTSFRAFGETTRTFPRPAPANRLLSRGRRTTDALASHEAEQSFDEYEYKATVGLSNAYWSAGSHSLLSGGRPAADEADSLVYTSPVFEQETHMLGWPQVILHGSSSAKVATFVARLADVAPDGHSALITDGALNGTRRKSLTNPEPMKPGEIYELKIPMAPTGWIIPARTSAAAGDLERRLSEPVADALSRPQPDPPRRRSSVPRRAARCSKSTIAPPEFLPPPVLRRVVTPSGSAVPSSKYLLTSSPTQPRCCFAPADLRCWTTSLEP